MTTLFALLGAVLLAAETAPTPCLVYFGTYTRGPNQGIFASRLDLQTGALTPPVLAAETANPSFLALHPNHRFLYAVGELNKAGAVNAFSIDPKTGLLTLLNQQSSGGNGPCHVAVDKTGQCLLVANYGGGSVSSFPIQPDGRLGPPASFIQHQGASVNPQRQKGPHAHSVGFDPANRFAFVSDLGLDKILIYRLDPAKAIITPHDPNSAITKPGAGPRHFAVHPGARHAYVINELDSTITTFDYDATRGVLKDIQTVSTLPADFTGPNTTAEIEIHPTGKFLYGSNRGHDSIAVFAIDAATGKLTFVEHASTQGKTPRNFAIDPTGKFLLAANQASDSVVVLRIDPQTGRLAHPGHTLSVPSPVCVTFLIP